MSKKLLWLSGIVIIAVHADNLQSRLMEIATAEAKIANIGANKAHMLYGINNPIPVINRWNELEHRPALTEDQIEQIKQLEAQKQSILSEAAK